MVYNYVKNNMDTKPDFKPTRNTLPAITSITRMNTSTRNVRNDIYIWLAMSEMTFTFD